MTDKTDLEIWAIPASQLGGTRTGITLRDYFAAKAMQGLLANPEMGDSNLHNGADDWLKNITECSYEFADAMLKARG